MYRTLSLCLLSLSVPLTCFGLAEDSTQPMQIVADSTSFNYKTRMNTYEGHVKIDQGTTHLTADRVVTQNNANHKMEQAVATGITDPADYTTLTKPGDPALHALAKSITFYPLTSTVVLEGDVHVSQGENSFQGPIIIYNMREETVTAPASQNGRATLVINAKQSIK